MTMRTDRTSAVVNPHHQQTETLDLLYYRTAPVDAIRLELAEYEIDPAATVIAVQELVAESLVHVTCERRKDTPQGCFVARGDASQTVDSVYRELFLAHLAKIEQVATYVSWRNRLDPADAADFVADVKLRFIEHDYAILRKFQGRATVSTYITTVVLRLFQQYRVETWGRWRPSAEARRLGTLAVVLEKLLSREQHTFEEAVQILTTGRAGVTRGELEALYVRLPMRQRRPIFVADDVTECDAIAVDIELPSMELERARIASTAVQVIDGVVASLTVNQQAILRLRFWHGQKVHDIARFLGEDQKRVYRELEQALLAFRRALKAAGIEASAINEIIERRDCDISFAGLPDRMQTPPCHHAEVRKEVGQQGGRRDTLH